MNENVTKLTHTKGWEYQTDWQRNLVMTANDTTLTLKFTSISVSPCQLVHVEGGANVRKFHEIKLGD